MKSLKRLFTHNLKYADLISEFRQLTKSERDKIRSDNSSFLDWLVDETAKGISSAKADEFLLLLQSVIGDKIIIGVTAVGSVKIDEIEARFMHTIDFVSVSFLRKMLLSRPNDFEVVIKSSVEIVRLASKHDRKEISDEKKSSSLTVQNNTSEQLRFLFKSRPDVIVCLQPSVTLPQLFKAYEFWKYFCKHSTSNFIAWIVTIAKLQCENSSCAYTFEEYTASLKKVIALEALNYVTAKSRTVRELTNLVSKTQTKFVDVEFVLEAVKDNAKILKLNRLPGSGFASSQLVSAVDKISTAKELSKPLPVTNSRVDIQLVTKTQTDVHAKTQHITCYLHDIVIEGDVSAKIFPLLTKKISWSVMVYTYTKLSSKNPQLVQKFVSRFDCFVTFLVKFCKQHKQELNSENYELHIMELVKGVALKEMRSLPEKKISSSKLLKLLANSGMVDSNFLLRSLQLCQCLELSGDDIILHGDANSGRETTSYLKSSIVDLSASSSSVRNMTFHELKNVGHLRMLITTDLRFEVFLRTCQLLQSEVKTSLKELSKSFYSLLFAIGQVHAPKPDAYEAHLKRMIVGKICDYFVMDCASSLKLQDMHDRICARDQFLIHSTEIRYAVEDCGLARNLEMDGEWIYLANSRSAYRDSLHSSDGSFIERNVPRFVSDIELMLARNESSHSRLKHILTHCKQLSEAFAEYILGKSGSWFEFITDEAPNSQVLHKIIETELLTFIGSKTLFCDQFIAGGCIFGDLRHFWRLETFIDFLQLRRDLFVVVSHPVVGSIVSVVRQTGQDDRPMFFDQFEGHTFTLCRQAFPQDARRISFSKLFQTIWHLEKLLSPQRNFIFGIGCRSIDGLKVFHEIYFRRYLMMYPALFSVTGDEVYLTQTPTKILPSKSPDASIVISDTESGTFHSDDSTHSSATRRRKRKNPHKPGKSSSDGPKHKRRKRKRKRSKTPNPSTSQSSISENDNESAETILSSLPDRLIQDVAVGRLLASGQSRMEFKDLLDTLISSLFSDKQKSSISSLTGFNDVFAARVTSVLLQENQFELTKNDEDPSYSEVRLVLQDSHKAESESHQPLVFKWVSCLTGVSNKKLSKYITKVLNLNRKPLSTGILFEMVCQKFQSKKATPEISDSILQCQTISCLKSDSFYYLDINDRSCIIEKHRQDSNDSGSLKNISGSLTDGEINNFIVSFIENNDKNCQGVSVDVLTFKVLSNFQKHFESTSACSVKLIIQGLVVENDKVGFTALGKIARLRGDTENKSYDSPVDSSDNDLKIDISDDDDRPVLPDSTNTKPDPASDRKSSVASVEEMYNNYIEGNVIRCDYSLPSRDKTPSIDSDALSPSSPLARPSDPRLRGRLFSAESIPERLAKVSSSGSHAVDADGTGKDCGGKNDCDSTFAGNPVKTKRQERVEKLKKFAVDFLSRQGNSAETQSLIDAGFEQLRGYRIARSQLAFEAYMRDILSTSGDTFSFGNSCGGVGATWVFYRPPRPGTTYHDKGKNLPFAEIQKEATEVAYSYLINLPDFKAPLSALCDSVAKHFSTELSNLHPDEMIPICRNLILTSFIRDLRRFYFGKTEPIVYIRKESLTSPTSPLQETTDVKPLSTPPSIPKSAPTEPNHRFTTTSKFTSVPSMTYSVASTRSSPVAYGVTATSPSIVAKLQFTPSMSAQLPPPETSPLSPPYELPNNPFVKVSRKSQTAINTVAALRLMADILRKHSPCMKLKLRDLWGDVNDKNLRKVFGTGVSFALSLRKFETYFPVSNDGTVSVDEKAFECFLKQNVH